MCDANKCLVSPDGKHEVSTGSVGLADEGVDTERAIVEFCCRFCGMEGSSAALFDAENIQWDPDPSEET